MCNEINMQMIMMQPNNSELYDVAFNPNSKEENDKLQENIEKMKEMLKQNTNVNTR